MTGKERDSKYKIVDVYEKFNWVSMGFFLLVIGGAVRTALALVDATQIVLARKYKRRKEK